MTEILIRKFDTPTDIVIVGGCLSWILSDSWFENKFSDKVLNRVGTYSNYEITMSAYGRDVSFEPMEWELENSGSITVLTEQEWLSLDEIEECIEDIEDVITIKKFQGSIYAVVVNTYGEYDIELMDNYLEEGNLLDAVLELNELDEDRHPVLRFKGNYEQIKRN